MPLVTAAAAANAKRRKQRSAEHELRCKREAERESARIERDEAEPREREAREAKREHQPTANTAKCEADKLAAVVSGSKPSGTPQVYLTGLIYIGVIRRLWRE